MKNNEKKFTVFFPVEWKDVTSPAACFTPRKKWIEKDLEAVQFAVLWFDEP